MAGADNMHNDSEDKDVTVLVEMSRWLPAGAP